VIYDLWYIYIYLYTILLNIGVYIKKLKDLLFQDSIDAYKVSYKGYHEWKINKSDIDKYRNDDNHKIVSPSFKLCGYTWYIYIYIYFIFTFIYIYIYI